MAEQGYVFNVGIEPEHFLVVKKEDGSIIVWDPKDVDRLRYPSYDFQSTANSMNYLIDMMDSMARIGWEPYKSDHEDGNGQFEINSMVAFSAWVRA